MSKNIKTQFDLYKAADNKVQECRAALEASMRERSVIVEQIVSELNRIQKRLEGEGR
ncbi:hypothetical protein M0R72_00735 [Candidatus Pacearchaeota archaeon]|jgi:hypothetical protein|nr:hypothetical protein [Candidatus Pacearchaeota archaeon]